MHSAYAPVPPVPGRPWHLLGPAIGATVITIAGLALETSTVLPAPVVDPPTVRYLSVVEILAIGAAFTALVLAWRRPVAAVVLQSVGAVVLVLVGSIAVWGLAGPAVALALAVGLHTARTARAQVLAAWPVGPSGPLDDAARRKVDHATRPGRRTTVALHVLAVGLVVLGLVWTGLDVARTHAFRSDPMTVTTTGTVVELDDDEIYATLDVDGARLVVEILTAPPAVGAELPVRANLAQGRAELLGTPFDPVGALVWSTFGVALLAALRHRARDVAALAAAAHGDASELMVLLTADVVTLVAPDGTVVAELDSPTLLDDPAVPASERTVVEHTAGTSETVAELERLTARAETLQARIDELDDDEIVELWTTDRRLAELEADLEGAVDPGIAAVLVEGALTTASAYVVPATGEAVLRTGDTLFRGTLHARRRRTPDGHSIDGVVRTLVDLVRPRRAVARADARDRARATPTLLDRVTRWLGDRDGRPMLVLHVALAALLWWLLADPTTSLWDTVRAVVFPFLLVQATWIVQPVVAVTRAHLLARGPLLVHRIPWSEITAISARDGAVVVRTLADGDSDAIVVPADPATAGVALARCRTAQDTAARLVTAWSAGRLHVASGARVVPSAPLLLACAWIAFGVASVLV